METFGGYVICRPLVCVSYFRIYMHTRKENISLREQDAWKQYINMENAQCYKIHGFAP